ncbi:hypothetical protein BLNAU_11776 [Blattamonas nauphoetae]|uniref:Transmembrane protein n=1 Tax=Blattamonas nauphoetae TaxID=2049346 RepID=A0ABQ9XPP1_9EUKA|nr:hypothetical protein BLNAU_11776 [Blattamonas nauphoetae]
MPRNRKESTVRSNDQDHPRNTDLTEELKEKRRPLFKDTCYVLLLLFIAPLLLYIPIYAADAMNEVKNGISPSYIFPWFIPDFLICVLIICLIILSIFHLGPSDAKKAKLCAVIASISVLLIVLFELSANRRFINQFFIDATSSQQSDNQQTSADHPLSPDEMEQPATDPAMEHSNEKTTPTQSDERSARQLENDHLLKVAKHIAETMPNFHPTTVRLVIQRISIDPKTPIPPRARIPIKTLVVAQLLLLLSFPAYFEKSSDNSILHDVVDVVLRLFVCLLPTLTALNGLQIIRVRWIFIPLPLLVLPLLRIDKATIPYRKSERPVNFFGPAIIVLYVSVFYLIGALIADGVLSWSFSVSTLPVSLLVVVVKMLVDLEDVFEEVSFSTKREKGCFSLLLCLIAVLFYILPFAVLHPMVLILTGFTPLNPFPWFYFDNLFCALIICFIILSIFHLGPSDAKKAKLCAVIASFYNKPGPSTYERVP